MRKLLIAASISILASLHLAPAAKTQDKEVVVMYGTPVCSEDGARAYAALHLANVKAFAKGDQKEIERTLGAIGDVQNKMCHRIPCCEDVAGVLTGNTLSYPGLDEDFLQVIVNGRRGYILQEDIRP